MKKLIFTFIILLFHLSIFSQDKTTQKKFSKSLSASIKKIDFQSSEDTYDDIDFGLGIDLRGSYYYKIDNRSTLRIGLGLHYLTTKSKDYSYVFGCDLTSGGVDKEHSYVESKLGWVYANIPIELQINLLNDGKRIYLKGGIDNYFYVAGSSRSTLYECGENPRDFDGLTLDPKSIFGQFNFGFGLELNIRTKAKLFIEPNVEYAFSNVMEIPTGVGQSVRSRIFNLALEMGIRF